MGDQLSLLTSIFEDFKACETQEQKEDFVKALYDNALQDIRPLLQLAPQLAKQTSTDIAPILAAFLEGYATILRNPEIRKVKSEITGLVAQIRAEALKVYIKAGFNRKEAFTLVLQDAANVKAMVSQLQDNSARAKVKSE